MGRLRIDSYTDAEKVQKNKDEVIEPFDSVSEKEEGGVFIDVMGGVTIGRAGGVRWMRLVRLRVCEYVASRWRPHDFQMRMASEPM